MNRLVCLLVSVAILSSLFTYSVGTSRAQSQIDVVAKSYYVYDIKTGKPILEKNARTQLPLASVGKLATVLAGLSTLPHETTIQIEPSDLLSEGDSGLVIGEEWALKDLCKFVLVASSNDGAAALGRILSEHTGKEGTTQLNNTAKSAGAKQMFFLNYSGLDVTTTLSGSYGSARDVALIMSALYKEQADVLASTRYDSLEVESGQLTHTVKNTNQDVLSTSGILGSKTGFTDLAGGNLAVITELSIGQSVVVVVLGSDKDNRFTDVKKLLQEATERTSSAKRNDN